MEKPSKKNVNSIIFKPKYATHLGKERKCLEAKVDF
jgi:hypothetical protein